MAVNALVTGLIVFKILRVFLEVKSSTTSVDRTLGSNGGTTLRHIIFVLVESGMALFAIQLVRVVLSNLLPGVQSAPYAANAVIGINQMFNVIILRSISFILSFVFTDNHSTWLGHRANNNFGASFNEIVLR